MRVGRSASRVYDLRIDQVARSAATVVKQAGSGRPVERFLRRFVDHLEEPQPQAAEPQRGPGKPPGRPR
jgi:hypothetical protein